MFQTSHIPVFVRSDNIVSSLGFSTSENMLKICEEQSGIGYVESGNFSSRTMPFALVNNSELDTGIDSLAIPGYFTRLEKMMIFSVNDAISKAGINVSDSRTVFVVSTTKGNIDELTANNSANPQQALWALGDRVRSYFDNPNRAVVISNACISGVLAVEMAARMIRSGNCDHAVVAGGDLVSRFVVSGFDSLHALSMLPCKPYDAGRQGLTLGEGCAAMVLSNQPDPGEKHGQVFISGGASSSDATHISAPDRTGTGLSLAIGRALGHSGLQAGDIDAVCAHGTATVYNDEMEAHAMRLAGLSDVPVYSLKGYWGHTLGAAGLMETVAVVHSLKKQCLYRTLGFESPGTSEKLNVATKTQNARIRHVLKTASGFGGCNAALVVSKTKS